MSDKKGISPLIATVLIIGFTIVLAVLVITWISGTVEETTETTDCMTEAQQVCLDSVGSLKLSGSATNPLVIVNEGADDLTTGLTVVQYDTTGATIGTAVTIATLNAYSTDSTSVLALNATATSVKVILTAEGKNGQCSVECTPVELTL